ncbi:MAG TPA: nickel transporter permease [Bacillota bacterium]
MGKGAGMDRLKQVKRALRRDPALLVGTVLILAMVVLALVGPLFTHYSPTVPDLPHSLQAPSLTHPFGTDEMGRDVLTRVIHGARVSLPVALMVMGIACVIGTIIGLVAGYSGGWVDELIMRVADIFLAFPALILAMAIAAALGPGLVNAMVAIAIVWWPWYARLVRSEVLSLRNREFVEAARAGGLGDLRIVVRHILVNALGPIIVQATLDTGYAILTTAGLSFVGLGAQPPSPEWGSMISVGRKYILDQWWYSTFPGVAIILSVLGFNLMGDGLRDVLDPRTRKQ